MTSTSPDSLLGQLPPYQAHQRTIERRQDTFDIIREILRKHKDTAPHYDRIAVNHWRGNVPDTVTDLYYWAKKHLPYRAEATNMQTVKTPAAILRERHDFKNDCKHYASYIVGVGEALRRQGFPVKCFYRFGSYNKGRRAPGHVFAVFVHDGREIWCDPTPEVGGFNKRYIVPCYTTDKHPPMAKREMGGIGSLYDITGVDSSPIPSNKIIVGMSPTRIIVGTSGHWTDMLPMSGTDDYTIGKHGKGKAKLKKAIKKIKPGKLLKKVGKATARNAFLVLTKLNVFHLATKSWPHIKAKGPDWKKLSDKWVEWGGKPDALFKNMRLGVNTYNKLHPHAQISGYFDTVDGLGIDNIGYPDTLGYYDDGMSVGDILCFVHDNHNRHMQRHARRNGFGIGVVAAPVAAGVIAAALPILNALKGILKSFGVDTNKADDAADQDTQDLADKHNAGDDTGTSVEDNADGSQTLKIDKVPGVTPGTGGATENGPAGDGADDEETTTKTKVKTKTKTVTTTGDDDGGGDMLANVKDFIVNHKMPLGLTVVGGGVLIYSVSHKFKKGSMMPVVLGLAGAAGLVMGGVGLFKKSE